MRLTKVLWAVAVAALALTAFASTASATTLEKEGVIQSGSITVGASLKSGSTLLLSDTSGFFANTCTTSTVEGSTSTKTGTAVEGSISVLSWGSFFSPCTQGNPTVDAKGSLSGERIGTTTNGTVKSKNAKVTVPSPFGLLTCTTPAEGTDVGTLTGVASGNATMDVSAVLNCGITARLAGYYTVTSPEGLGFTG